VSPRKKKSEVSARAPRARSAHNRQRQRLIDACISALHIYGPSRTTVEKVVAIAKMSPGIVRFYFDSKAAMLVASLQFLSTEFEDQLLVPVSKLKSNPVAALELMVDLYLDPEIASPRKVSVWYAFWGEASSRQEYYDICGQKDEGFAILVRELIGRLIEDTAQSQLDPDGIALGLIGVLEMLWQDFAFRSEEDIDRPAAKRRCMAYLKSVFPGRFPAAPSLSGRAIGGTPPTPDRFAGWVYGSERAWALERDALFRASRQIVAHESELRRAGDFVTADLGVERVLLVRDTYGAVRALRNSCPHVPHALLSARRGRLEEGIECAAHGLRFAADGTCIAGGGADLAALELTTADGLYWVRSSAPAPGGVAEDAEPEERASARSAERLRTDARLLALPDLEVRANWKLVAEQWLDMLGLGPDDVAALGAAAIDWSVAPVDAEAGWSAARYRRLAGSAAKGPWLMRFVAPNQLIERRPDGLSVLQIIATGPAQCRIRRIHLVREDHARDGSGLGALQYLAGRIIPWCRRGSLDIGESAQQGLSEFGYRTAAGPASPAVAWFRRLLISRLPALAAERPPNESR
jgi:TetR/AcrR family transcriptional regulator, transcriptional repressor of bet genes